MKAEEKGHQGTGRFLMKEPGSMKSYRWGRKYLLILVLLAWDGLLLYMIVEYLIEPVYGAAFVAAVSVYLGYQF